METRIARINTFRVSTSPRIFVFASARALLAEVCVSSEELHQQRSFEYQ